MSVEKPNVLIFGGICTCTRTLAVYLINKDKPLVNKIRIVDKYSVDPPTTYLDCEFKNILAYPNIEYKQANFTVPDAVYRMFEPNEGDALFTYVFDLTGENAHDRPAYVYIQQTTYVARVIGQEAARRRVKAYVRLQLPYYESSEKGLHTEKEVLKPVGIQGVWWQEALRVLAAIEGLNLVIIRTGFIYGPYIDYNRIGMQIVLAGIYGHEKKQLDVLWPPGKDSTHTVHVIDVVGALWECAKWVSKLGRKEADIVAGEVITPNEKSKVKEVDWIPRHEQKLIAPLFNLVDDSKSTVLSVGSTLCANFGTTFGFLNFITSTLAKLVGIPEFIYESMNEQHVSIWANMCARSNPPVHTHLSAYVEEYYLGVFHVALNADKLKEIVGYKLKKPEFTVENIKEMIDKWKAEGTWPNVD